MENIIKFIIVMLSAVTLENIVFTRALGVDKSTLNIRSPKAISLFGAMTTVLLILSVGINYFLNFWIGQYNKTAVFQYMICFVSSMAAYIVVVMATMKINYGFYFKVKHMLLISMFTGCVYGTVLVVSIHPGDLVFALANALGSGIGFTLTMFLIYMGKERIALLNVPKAFKGVPIMLLYLGILSLAIYGLIGHQLPA